MYAQVTKVPKIQSISNKIYEAKEYSFLNIGINMDRSIYCTIDN